MWHHLVDPFQAYSNYAPGAKNGPAAGVSLYKITFSEYGRVAYQIKGNEAYNNVLATVWPLHTPFTPGWDQRVFFYIFWK